MNTMLSTDQSRATQYLEVADARERQAHRDVPRGTPELDEDEARYLWRDRRRHVESNDVPRGIEDARRVRLLVGLYIALGLVLASLLYLSGVAGWVLGVLR